MSDCSPEQEGLYESSRNDIREMYGPWEPHEPTPRPDAIEPHEVTHVAQSPDSEEAVVNESASDQPEGSTSRFRLTDEERALGRERLAALRQQHPFLQSNRDEH